MRNILFSTTRQWNVGDEFILFGAIHLMRSIFPEGFNPIIYNRHPDLRTDIPALYDLHNIKIYAAEQTTLIADANFRVGFRDNSFKASTDGHFIDLVVFAGTPEWSNSRCFDLYQMIEKYDIPVIALGIGNQIQDECDLVLRNLSRFSLFTVRSPELIPKLSQLISPPPKFLPCPSICSAAAEQMRSVEEVTHIGLVYACDIDRSEVNNCVSPETYQYLLGVFRHIQHKYPGIKYSLICHYIDELPFAHSDFPDIEVLYSFDAKDYYDIYNRFDLVIGARVHGIGCAASMGIPGICIAHDFRGETVKGFLADVLSVGEPLKAVDETLSRAITSISERSCALQTLITETTNKYQELLGTISTLPVKNFHKYMPPLAPPVSNLFEGRPRLLDCVQELLDLPNSRSVARDQALAERDAISLERNQALAERDAMSLERSQALAQRDAMSLERDQALAQRDAMSLERDQALAQRDAMLVDRSRMMEERAAMLEERKQALAERAAMWEERNQTLAEREKISAERDQMQAEQAAMLAERDQALAERDRICVERDRALAERTVISEERDILVNSTSWRITAPIRAVLDYLKRLLRREN